MARLERVYEDSKTGWSDWISPIHKRYQMACCDCGLTHTLRFRVIRVTRYHGGFFTYRRQSGYRVQLQARRNERATAQVRRHKKWD